MKCTRCEANLLNTKIGKICMECGLLIDAKAKVETVITPHSELVRAEHRLSDPTEPGAGQVEDITDMAAFTAESNSAYGAFTWIQVAVSRFSYYAIVFVLVIIASGLSINLFVTHRPKTARANCVNNISRTSSEPVEAGTSVSPSPSMVCEK